MAKKTPIVDGEQRLLDMDVVRERLALYARLRQKETDLQQEECELTAQLKETRRKLKECRWDLRSATSAVDRHAKAILGAETPDGKEAAR